MQAAVARDIKRLLAFSTSENIGLILLGVGAAGMLARAGNATVAGLAMTAALLHAANHAGFKTLLFTGAGSVVRATGTRDLDQWGGLVRRMPATTAMVAVGALCAAALPPGNGFISEWLLLQALLHSDPGDTMFAVAAPVAVAVVALTAGVGAATFVKAVGTGLLARPRSSAAASAVESPPACSRPWARPAGLRVPGGRAGRDPAGLVPGDNRAGDRIRAGGHDTPGLRLAGSPRRSGHCGSPSAWSR
jgi:formate hydrogenlyase subunit 3/multisubunit Na+/H+ antiporter MnhD subunit